MRGEHRSLRAGHEETLMPVACDPIRDSLADSHAYRKLLQNWSTW